MVGNWKKWWLFKNDQFSLENLDICFARTVENGNVHWKNRCGNQFPVIPEWVWQLATTAMFENRDPQMAIWMGGIVHPLDLGVSCVPMYWYWYRHQYRYRYGNRYWYWWCIDVLMYWCIDVLMCWCVDLLMYFCIDVLVFWCIDVLMYWCIDVSMWWCNDIMMHWCTDVVDVLMYWCIDWCIDVCMYVGMYVLPLAIVFGRHQVKTQLVQEQRRNSAAIPCPLSWRETPAEDWPRKRNHPQKWHRFETYKEATNRPTRNQPLLVDDSPFRPNHHVLRM